MQDRIDHPTSAVPAAPIPAAPVVAHFWLMTVQYQPQPGVLAGATFNGKVDVAPGMSRTLLYKEVRRYVGGQLAISDFAVLFFELAPESMGGAG